MGQLNVTPEFLDALDNAPEEERLKYFQSLADDEKTQIADGYTKRNNPNQGQDATGAFQEGLGRAFSSPPESEQLSLKEVGGALSAFANRATLGWFAGTKSPAQQYLTTEQVQNMDDKTLAQWGYLPQDRQRLIDHLGESDQRKAAYRQVESEHPVAALGGNLISPLKGLGGAKVLSNPVGRGIGALATKEGAGELLGAGTRVAAEAATYGEAMAPSTESAEDGWVRRGRDLLIGGAFGVAGRALQGVAESGFNVVNKWVGRPGTYRPPINGQPEYLGDGIQPLPKGVQGPNPADMGLGLKGRRYEAAVESAQSEWATSTGKLGAPNAEIRKELRDAMSIAMFRTNSLKARMDEFGKIIGNMWAKGSDEWNHAMKMAPEIEKEMVSEISEKLGTWTKPVARNVEDVGSRYSKDVSLVEAGKDSVKAMVPAFRQTMSHFVPGYNYVSAVTKRTGSRILIHGLDEIKRVLSFPEEFGIAGEAIGRAYAAKGLDGAVKERYVQWQSNPEYRQKMKQLQEDLGGNGPVPPDFPNPAGEE